MAEAMGKEEGKGKGGGGGVNPRRVTFAGGCFPKAVVAAQLKPPHSGKGVDFVLGCCHVHSRSPVGTATFRGRGVEEGLSPPSWDPLSARLGSSVRCAYMDLTQKNIHRCLVLK